jgi:hypothetical protein
LTVHDVKGALLIAFIDLWFSCSSSCINAVMSKIMWHWFDHEYRYHVQEEEIMPIIVVVSAQFLATQQKKLKRTNGMNHRARQQRDYFCPEFRCRWLLSYRQLPVGMFIQIDGGWAALTWVILTSGVDNSVKTDFFGLLQMIFVVAC